MGPFPHYLWRTSSCHKTKSKESEACYCHVVVDSSQNSLFERGTFKLELFLLEKIIIEPEAYFMTKIYHPITYQLGRLGLGI